MNWTNTYSLKQTGAFIKECRKQKGYTQEDFSTVLDISHATLSALENGRSVSTKTMEKALNYLGLRLVIVPKPAQVTVRLPSTEEARNE